MKQEIQVPGSGKPSNQQEKPKDESNKHLSRDEVLELILKKSPEEFLPWEKCTLPSAGMYYDGKIPGGEIEVKPMGLMADKILATQRLAQSGQTIEYIYKNHVKFPTEFDPLDLLVGDRMFLLFYLRGITHGNTYEFSVTCTNDDCKKVSMHMYDLNKVAETIKGASVTEPIKIILPKMTELIRKETNNSDVEVYVEAKFMRGRDLEVMTRSHKIKENMQAGIARNANVKLPSKNIPNIDNVSLDSTIEDHLHMVIVSANGNTDRRKIADLCKRMSSADTAEIRHQLSEKEPGIDSAIILTCPECKQEMRMNLPITESFFRPTNTGGVRV
jgi:hypothetical protein